MNVCSRILGLKYVFKNVFISLSVFLRCPASIIQTVPIGIKPIIVKPPVICLYHKPCV